ncbi:MAG: hypothetical protein ACKVTZ_12105 [Bacteroidia bacterium]
MRKSLFIYLGIAFGLGAAACTSKSNETVRSLAQTTQVPTVTKSKGNYLGSNYKGNYVWGGAMNLAWNELNENVLHEKVKLKTEDSVALKMADKFNNPIFSKKDLDEKSYYVKSGYGQETVNAINQETKKKFPKKSFEDLQLDLSPSDIISYAYFLKEVEYLTLFEKKEMLFEGKNVEGFYAKTKTQKDNIQVIKYEGDDKFIISLRLKEEQDQLILAKGFDMDEPENVLKEINEPSQASFRLGKPDQFAAPNLQLTHHRTYKEMIGKYLANKGFESYFIAEMFENIKFEMDEKGAKAENEAVIVMSKSAEMPEPPKKFILDKPYWVMMKRKESLNPYFILGVKNTEVMKIASTQEQK